MEIEVIQKDVVVVVVVVVVMSILHIPWWMLDNSASDNIKFIHCKIKG